MSRVLVAGASGALGAALVGALKAREHRVRALTRDPGRLTDDVDEVFVGDLRYPGSLRGACDGVDAVFSCAGARLGWVGLWRGGGNSFRDVDEWGNRNLLAEAQRAKVRRFGYVSVYGGGFLGRLEYIRAHESFAAALRGSGLDHLIVRPTGYFSAYRALLGMARKGRVIVLGDGSARTNPIHEADLAAVCADALVDPEHDLNVGGPLTHTRLEMAEMAFRALGGEPRIRRRSMGAAGLMLGLARLTGRHNHDSARFKMVASLTDAIAPAHGTRTLEDYFRELAHQTALG